MCVSHSVCIVLVHTYVRMNVSANACGTELLYVNVNSDSVMWVHL